MKMNPADWRMLAHFHGEATKFAFSHFAVGDRDQKEALRLQAMAALASYKLLIDRMEYEAQRFMAASDPAPALDPTPVAHTIPTSEA